MAISVKTEGGAEEYSTLISFLTKASSGTVFISVGSKITKQQAHTHYNTEPKNILTIYNHCQLCVKHDSHKNIREILQNAYL